MRIRVWVNTNRVGSQVEDELELADEDVVAGEEGLLFLESAAQDYMFQMIDWGWEQIGD
jgi:hypothetical protein